MSLQNWLSKMAVNVEPPNIKADCSGLLDTCRSKLVNFFAYVKKNTTKKLYGIEGLKKCIEDLEKMQPDEISLEQVDDLFTFAFAMPADLKLRLDSIGESKSAELQASLAGKSGKADGKPSAAKPKSTASGKAGGRKANAAEWEAAAQMFR